MSEGKLLQPSVSEEKLIQSSVSKEKLVHLPDVITLTKIDVIHS